jgi:hypothetical protein
MSTVSCKNCGEICEWKKLPKGKFFPHDIATGKPHKCKNIEDDTEPEQELPEDSYQQPITLTDEFILARQVARLATAIEDSKIVLEQVLRRIDATTKSTDR